MAVTEGYNLIKAEFNGRNGEGSISLPGLKEGDRMFWLSEDGAYDFPGHFEKIVTTDDELVQTQNSDLTGHSYVVIFIRI